MTREEILEAIDLHRDLLGPKFNVTQAELRSALRVALDSVGEAWEERDTAVRGLRHWKNRTREKQGEIDGLKRELKKLYLRFEGALKEGRDHV